MAVQGYAEFFTDHVRYHLTVNSLLFEFDAPRMSQPTLRYITECLNSGLVYPLKTGNMELHAHRHLGQRATLPIRLTFGPITIDLDVYSILTAKLLVAEVARINLEELRSHPGPDPKICLRTLIGMRPEVDSILLRRYTDEETSTHVELPVWAMKVFLRYISEITLSSTCWDSPGDMENNYGIAEQDGVQISILTTGYQGQFVLSVMHAGVTSPSGMTFGIEDIPEIIRVSAGFPSALGKCEYNLEKIRRDCAYDWALRSCPDFVPPVTKEEQIRSTLEKLQEILTT